jgi:hypothetical protein
MAENEMEIPPFGRDDRYLVDTQRERSGEPQRCHFTIYPEYCCGSPLLSLKFYPKVLSSLIPTNRSLRRFGGMRDLLLKCRNL